MIKYPMGFKGPANQLRPFLSDSQALNACEKLLDGALLHWKFHQESSMAEAHFAGSRTPVKTVLHWPPETGLGTCTCDLKTTCWHLQATLLETKSRIDVLPPFIQQVQLSKSPDKAFAVWLHKQHHDPYPQMAKHRLLYILSADENDQSLWLELHKGYITKEEKYIKKSELTASVLSQKPLPKFVTLHDQSLLIHLQQKGWDHQHRIPLNPIASDEFIESMLATQRCFWRSCYRRPLEMQEVSRVPSNYEKIELSGPFTLSPIENIIYKKRQSSTPRSPLQIHDLHQIQPVLKLKTRPLHLDLINKHHFNVDHLQIQFKYNEIEFGFDDITNEKVHVDQGTLKALLSYHHQLDRLDSIHTHFEYPVSRHFHISDRYLEEDFIHTTLLLISLRRDGWKIEISANHRLNQKVINDMYLQLHDADESTHWFDLELGVTVDGQPINLIPWLKKSLQSRQESMVSTIQMKDGSIVQLSESLQEKLQKVVNGLLPDSKDFNKNSLKLNKHQLLLLSQWKDKSKDIDDSTEWNWSDKAKHTITEVKQSYEKASIPIPKELNATLRDYQLRGVAWMQFLRSQQFAGILADDMGLGKTLQTLAHVLVEKSSGRMQTPALIVVPTSLIGNWENEINTFTPSLKFVTLRGMNRFEHYQDLSDYDIVIVSYGILVKDIDCLCEQEFYLQILDEAQAIKNSRTKKAQCVRKVPAKHRLCLTGTPIENHLGEIWSQFYFLMPGFLSSEKQFNDNFKNPIEKQNDTDKQDILANRIAPFMLRRKKSEVAKELPSKSEIIQWIQMPEEQKNTYETIRLMVSEEIQKALRAQTKNQFAVTNALLRLRQVCCHPGLIDKELKSSDSAKLNWLLDTLPQLIEEGRRVLIFSSFRKMLDILSASFNKINIDHLLLTGQTDADKRTQQVKSFQNQEVPVFLISLKAGGAGLNLTAADTVIHFDPWWNPAAENQASDRAHRIGQDKKVFVYKLICRGTVEEKIHLMQKQKQKLADSFLARKNQNSGFSEAQWQDLLSPITAPSQ